MTLTAFVTPDFSPYSYKTRRNCESKGPELEMDWIHPWIGLNWIARLRTRFN